jgi:hypothetical protein
LYVIDEDEHGAAYLLFPLPGLVPVNPLAAGQRHLLPGSKDGKAIDWQVSSAGGQEHLLLVASPGRLADFEAELAALPLAGANGESQYATLSERAKLTLRGIGGLQAQGPAGAATSPSQRLFDLAAALAAHSESVHGVWMRQVTFENPAAPKE